MVCTSRMTVRRCDFRVEIHVKKGGERSNEKFDMGHKEDIEQIDLTEHFVLY